MKSIKERFELNKQERFIDDMERKWWTKYHNEKGWWDELFSEINELPTRTRVHWF